MLISSYRWCSGCSQNYWKFTSQLPLAGSSMPRHDPSCNQFSGSEQSPCRNTQQIRGPFALASQKWIWIPNESSIFLPTHGQPREKGIRPFSQGAPTFMLPLSISFLIPSSSPGNIFLVVGMALSWRWWWLLLLSSTIRLEWFPWPKGLGFWNGCVLCSLLSYSYLKATNTEWLNSL